MILINASGHRLSVPKHRELDWGLLNDLINKIGLSKDEFRHY